MSKAKQIGKTFTVVGTAVNEDGTMKLRWANDLGARVKILHANKCTDIKLVELPSPMSKLDAAKYYKANHSLTPEQDEIVTFKINEKAHVAKQNDVQATLTSNINSKVQDPKITSS